MQLRVRRRGPRSRQTPSWWSPQPKLRLPTVSAMPAVGVPSPADQNAARGARYYQPRPSPAARTVKPEDLELMRRLHEMRDASDLILQFGPYKGTTLAQVAMNHPEYVRQLMTRAQRPEVRAAAGRVGRSTRSGRRAQAETGPRRKPSGPIDHIATQMLAGERVRVPALRRIRHRSPRARAMQSGLG